jgi:hypothetical protein
MKDETSTADSTQRAFFSLRLLKRHMKKAIAKIRATQLATKVIHGDTQMGGEHREQGSQGCEAAAHSKKMHE